MYTPIHVYVFRCMCTHTFSCSYRSNSNLKYNLCIYPNIRYGHSAHTFQVQKKSILFPSPFSSPTLKKIDRKKNLIIFLRAVQERARKTNADDTFESGSRLAEISRKVLTIDHSLRTINAKTIQILKRYEYAAYSEKRTNVSQHTPSSSIISDDPLDLLRIIELDLSFPVFFYFKIRISSFSVFPIFCFCVFLHFWTELVNFRIHVSLTGIFFQFFLEIPWAQV